MYTVKRYTKGFVRYLRNTRAVSALEYALLVGVVTVAIAAAVTAFMEEVEDAFEVIGAAIDEPQVATPDADPTT